MAGLYFHIPFCRQACHYCDFHFSTQLNYKHDLVKALIGELKLQKDYLEKETIKTIYFGGGTPSLLTTDELGQLLNTIAHYYSVHSEAEITLEANPDDITIEKLNDLYSLGVNRLSIGIQSFDDDVLTFFNRAHNSTDAVESVNKSREAGFKNISLDLIYAVPGQSHETWLRNINKALELQPEHISSYSLTIEDKTAFGKWAKAGKLKGVDDDLAAQEFELLMNELNKGGYEHYEISNFSKPGFHSKHNSNYWRQEKYLGIGPSAHSFNRESRQYNVSNNTLYIKSISEGKVPFEQEVLTEENKINEYLFTSLRTSWGCDLNYLKTYLHFDLLQTQHVYLKDLENRDLIHIDGSVMKLTHRGKFLADQIASDLFIVV